MDPEIVPALIGPVLTAGLAASAVGFKEWQRQVSAGYPPSG